jgi:hypothetical protein
LTAPAWIGSGSLRPCSSIPRNTGRVSVSVTSGFFSTRPLVLLSTAFDSSSAQVSLRSVKTTLMPIFRPSTFRWSRRSAMKSNSSSMLMPRTTSGPCVEVAGLSAPSRSISWPVLLIV